MFARITFALMVLGYCVCIAVALIDRQYFQASVFFLVATLHTLSRFEVGRPEAISGDDLLLLPQLMLLSMGLAFIVYLALIKP